MDTSLVRPELCYPARKWGDPNWDLPGNANQTNEYLPVKDLELKSIPDFMLLLPDLLRLIKVENY